MQDSILKRPMRVEVNERKQAYVVVSATQVEDLKRIFEREGLAYRLRQLPYNEDVFFDFGPDEDLIKLQAVLDAWSQGPRSILD